MPVLIPTLLPECGLKVAGITKPWIENEIIAFCDAHVHEAWNMSDKPRIVIILDVIKKDFLAQTNEICSVVLAAMQYQQAAQQYKFVKKIVE